MTTARAASSATLSVALEPRKAVAVPLEEVLREVEVQEVARRVGAVHVEAVIPQGNRTVAVVVPAVTKTAITIHRAAEAEAAEGNGYV